MSEPRPTASTINDAQLDDLYERLDQAETELRRYAEAESADAAAGSYAGRAEHAEAAIERVREWADYHANQCEGWCCDHAPKLLAALDEPTKD
jgi:hypothetical protein